MMLIADSCFYVAVMAKRETSDVDAFTSSMSFANLADCDCDECGSICEIPPPIIDAIKVHKKRKLLEVMPSQGRSLIMRDGGISIWKIEMPPGAQPLTEFGYSHRFIFVKTLPKGRIVKSIGEGIIGSSSEEKNRKQVNWEQGRAIFFKSNGGKAMGWLNEIQDGDKMLDALDCSMTIVIYAVKATDSALTVASSSITSLFQKYLKLETREVEADDILSLRDILETNIIED